MSLFVPILRLCLLFFNIYGSYKTLKPPRPSSRSRSGLPSQTALMQRKRDLKGCMTVWIVWCCMAVYERHAERIISLFIPFYDEFKAMALLFLIATRAKGAEPIFLHAIRPFLKPYTSTIDSILDLCRMVGDIIFALLGFCMRSAGDVFKKAYQALPSSIQVPFSYIGALLPVLPALHHSHTTTTTSTPNYNGPPPLAPQFMGAPRYPQSYSTPHSTIEGLPHDDPDSLFSPPTRGQPIIDDPNSLFTPPGMVQPVELPSLQSLIYANPNAPPGQPSTAPTPGADAWNWDWDSRQYPSFPSAYPPTPLANNLNLPAKGRRLAKDPWRTADGTIVEEDDEYPHYQHPPPPGNGQGFHQSLLPPRKPLNPGFEKRDMSDEKLRGINETKTKYMEEDGSSESDVGDAERDRTVLAGIGMNEGDEADDSMDMDSGVDSDGSFNVTLSTPRAPLEPSGSAASIMTLRSTMRTRASARSLFVSYPAPVSADADIEEESERSGRSSRSSSQSRVGLTSTNDERTVSSGSTSAESFVLGAVSVSSLEAAIATDADTREARVGQKRRLQRTASPDRERPEDTTSSSRKFSTIRQTRRTGRSLRTRNVPEGDRLTTEDEGSSSRSSSRQRPMTARSRVSATQTKPSLPRGASSLTLPVRKRRKVDEVGLHTNVSFKSKETDPPTIKPSEKSSTRAPLRPKRPLASSKISTSTITNTRATSQLRAPNLKEESSESSSQP